MRGVGWRLEEGIAFIFFLNSITLPINSALHVAPYRGWLAGWFCEALASDALHSDFIDTIRCIRIKPGGDDNGNSENKKLETRKPRKIKRIGKKSDLLYTRSDM
jgi:hypothetical protein